MIPTPIPSRTTADRPTDDSSADDSPAGQIQLSIAGMTCASCAARVEKKLNQLDGVSASVNFATEKATVRYPASVHPSELVSAVEQTGYHAAVPAESPAGSADTVEAYPNAALRTRLWVCAVLAVAIVVVAGIPAAQFRGWQWVLLALATAIVTWGAWPFHVATVRNARHRASTMDTLVSVGVAAAYLWSVWALVWGGAGALDATMSGELFGRGSGRGGLYFEVVAAVTVFLLAGRLIESRAKRQSGAALRALLDLGAKDVGVIRAGAETRRPIGELQVGDRFVVRPGERVATDGIIEDGHSALDASMLTGEPVPIDVEPGDAVTGATVNSGGRLIVRATRVGADTQLARMGRLVEQAQSGQAPVQRLADRVSAVFVPTVFAVAAVTLVAWLIASGSWRDAFTATIAVLIIACPCALGLATPTALLVGTGRGAQLGILIRGPEVLESTRRVDTVVLDKTGTVTSAALAVVDSIGEERTLALAGAVEDASEHPIGQAIARAARAAGKLDAVTDFVNLPGLGVMADVAGQRIQVGRAGWIGAVPADLAASAAAAEQGGRTVVWVGIDGRVVGAIELADTVKPTSAEAIDRLKSLGLRPILLTGDNERAAESVAADVGIETIDVIAGVLPAGKVDEIARLQQQGRTVAMVGDGVNDAAALARADLGLAMGTGTDVAIEASDITLVRGDLRTAADAIRLSRATLRTIKVNLFWAFAYNVAAIPLAALGYLNPLVAGFAMALSSVFVVTNSLRLRRFR